MVASITQPTRLPSPPEKSVFAKPSLNPADGPFSRAALAHYPAARSVGTAWRAVPYGLTSAAASSLTFREHNEIFFMQEKAAEHRAKMLLLNTDKATKEEARTQRIEKQCKLSEEVLAKLRQLAEPDGLDALEADAREVTDAACEVLESALNWEATIISLANDVDELAFTSRDGAERQLPLPVPEAQALVTLHLQLKDDANTADAEVSFARAAVSGVVARANLLGEKAERALWEKDSEAAEMAALKGHTMAKRVDIHRSELADAEAKLERASQTLEPLTGRLNAIASILALANADALLAFARAQAAAPKRRPAGTRLTTLSPLNDEEEDMVDELLGPGGGTGESIISEFEGQPVRRHDILTLRPVQWLNDEVINVYLKLVLARAGRDGAGSGVAGAPLRAHVFQSFFYTKLADRGYDYKGIRRWTKNIDIFALDALLVPINQSRSHWVLAVANMREKRFEFYDSLGGRGKAQMEMIRQYLADEHMDKKKTELDLGEWEDVAWKRSEIPYQDNGSDCGAFMCQFASTLVRNVAVNFTCHDMPYMRRRMVVEIMTKELRDDVDV